jgi:hypothetical protein
VADDGSATVRRVGKVSSMLHGQRTARGELGRRSPWSCSRRRRRSDSDGRGTRTATVGRAASARSLSGRRWRA